jgi:hypothetical protein
MLQWGKSEEGKHMCLQVEQVEVEGEAGGVAIDGAYTTLVSCVEGGAGSAAEHRQKQQSWLFMPDGTVRPFVGSTGADAEAAAPYCLTASWPFVTAAAFIVPPPQNEVVLVAMNEASTSAYFLVEGAGSGDQVLPSELPPHSIRTYVLPRA